MTPAASSPVRFPITYSKPSRLMVLVGMRPANSFVDVSSDEIRTEMSWAFKLTAQRSGVREVMPRAGRVLSRGVHGWRGRWLVNGSGRGLVTITFDPAPRGRMWPFHIRVKELTVSVDDPAALVAALTAD